ncbi:MAG: deaminase, partial [Gammaproteobacteria bacterium]|nr:deaminase [Gammaproteobacteria bacterium]
MLNPDLLKLLKENDPLRKFIVGFHNRLAHDNPDRETSNCLTQDQKAMDDLGRLLVGDEVCAAIAADGKQLFVSSNQTEHSRLCVTFKIDEICIQVDSSGEKVSMDAYIRLDFILGNGQTNELPEKQKVHFGEYKYNKTDSTLKLIGKNTTTRCDVPFSLHQIDSCPFPIGMVFLLKDFLSLGDIGCENEIIRPNNIIRQIAKEHRKLTFNLRVDPLLRRSFVLFSHLGYFCLLQEKNKAGVIYGKHVYSILLGIENHRKRVMEQTLCWELAEKYNLEKVKRIFDDSDLKGKALKIRREKREELVVLEGFVSQIVEHLNNYLREYLKILLFKVQETGKWLFVEQTQLISGWLDKLNKDINESFILVPEIIQKSLKFPLDNFLGLARDNILSLLSLEQYICERSTFYPNLFTYTLARIAESEIMGRNAEGMIEIIDGDLPKGTHAEIRLFYYFSILNSRAVSEIPYFGITQLCCACCNTLFKSHGLHYVQGSVHRAGTHGKYYPGWVFDKKLRTDDVLRNLFGKKLFAQYKSLLKEDSPDREKYEDLIFEIIKQLSTLWKKNATQEKLDEIESLGFRRNEIWNEKSNFPDRKSCAPISLVKTNLMDYMKFENFCRRLEYTFNLKINFVKIEGESLYKAFAKQLYLKAPEEYWRVIALGGERLPVEQWYTFWEDRLKICLAAKIIEENVSKYIQEDQDFLNETSPNKQNIPSKYGELIALASLYRKFIVILSESS